ncbi:MAG: hypothetical protein JXR03_03860 [Cyclobacteriaceae bacterium]
MTLFDFIRLIYRNGRIISFVAASLAIFAFLFVRNQKNQYVSEAVIYTGIASGFSIESGEQSKSDYHAINNAFDNLMSVIKSRVTLEEVSLRLLATHLHQDKSSADIIGADALEALGNSFPSGLKEKVIDSSIISTYNKLRVLYEARNSYLHDLLEKGTSHYAIKSLKEIAAKRNKSSDMVELAYISSDPAIAKMTLDLMLEVFSRRYRGIKESETGDVVAYFQAELAKVKVNLVDAEDRLTAFRVKSRVINYVEQTKAIAFKKQNALEDYALKKMNLKATEAALLQLEDKLEIREKLLSKNVELLNKKNRLTAITSSIAYSEANADSSSNMQQLIAEQDFLKKEIATDVEMLFDFKNTREGIPSRQLLDDWLNNLIQLNKEQVNVKLYSSRLKELDAEYDRMAPMGSTISRLEREIDVFEREYLEVLHGLNMAKLRQQNIQMSSNLEILDNPKYPREPLSSKKKLIVIAAFLFGIIGTLSLLIAMEMLDKSLKTPKKAKLYSGLEIAGALPVTNDSLQAKYPEVLEKAQAMLANKVMMEKEFLGREKPTLILGVSTKGEEGKTHTLRALFNELKKLGERVCLIIPRVGDSNDGDDIFSYELSHLTLVKNLNTIVSHDLTDYDTILFEVPAWVNGQVPTHLIKQSSMALWVTKASDSWSVTHQSMLADFNKFSPTPPLLMINGIKPYNLDQIIGEVPSKRSALVTLVRRVVKFEFSSVQFQKL